MTQFCGLNYLAGNLRETAGAISEIAQLVREDTARRDTGDEMPFLTPGSLDYLMAAIRQLSDHASSICDDLERLGEGRGRK